ncbi:hypothetical protein BC835DRAFT_1348694 [Cytidiella melzeri]|nr:hypothetical protein BC835DRAFT_1348694 [Cytidiella melzeri]
MQFSTSLFFLATIVASTVYTVTVSATPYGIQAGKPNNLERRSTDNSHSLHALYQNKRRSSRQRVIAKLAELKEMEKAADSEAAVQAMMLRELKKQKAREAREAADAAAKADAKADAKAPIVEANGAKEVEGEAGAPATSTSTTGREPKKVVHFA